VAGGGTDVKGGDWVPGGGIGVDVSGHRSGVFVGAATTVGVECAHGERVVPVGGTAVRGISVTDRASGVAVASGATGVLVGKTAVSPGKMTGVVSGGTGGCATPTVETGSATTGCTVGLGDGAGCRASSRGETSPGRRMPKETS
jgi:hypothetical protein